ncbi:sulfotransferase [Burkholderia pseudomallei]|uniref:sulfotransferase family protein n=1 Tax=Burkholderia pseudomallei TaxID=28450 RepID=UPI001AA00848|nr:sulfotransferase [Burkholderia pseudomallei]MBO7789441.1 sulfotransferase [Burkholderia pseudomallei]QTB35282.1 sulfotransferase [Burkholderia pseudomallei]QWJ93841.1 sulfotransferase [Burkholderia pseudomallei]
MNIHFISGLPRAGSTLLSVLLAQNPRIHATITSPLFSIATAMRQAMSTSSEHYQLMNERKRLKLYAGLFDSYYEDAYKAGKTIVFDSNRSWLQLQALTSAVFPGARTIVCVRSPSWVIDSLEQLFLANAAVIPQYFNDAFEARSLYSRTDALMRPDRMVGASWSNLREAFYGPQSEQLLIVEYTALVADPEATLRTLYNFIGEPFFEHKYSELRIESQDDIDRFDYAMGVPGLHRVGGEVRRRARATVLPPELYERLERMAFWREVNATNAKVLLGPPETPANRHATQTAE